MTRRDRIVVTLTSRFSPTVVEVQDDSALHAGHAGAGPGGETHYSIRLVTEAFSGMGRLARSRLVHDSLAEEFGTGLHAITLRLRAPAEVEHTET